MTLEEVRKRADGRATAIHSDYRSLLLAHCFNRFDEVVEALERVLNETNAGLWDDVYAVSAAKDVLARAKEIMP